MITLESIKTEQTKLAKMITRLEEEIKKSDFFVYQGKRIQLEPGEQYAGTIISANGSRNHHIILLPGEAEKKTWRGAMEWAASIGGELFDRCEGALLFATMRDEFKTEWHWTREQHASDSDYAWFQRFDYGYQLINLKSSELRARAVRRLTIQ